MATIHPLSIYLSTFALEEASPFDYWMWCGDIQMWIDTSTRCAFYRTKLELGVCANTSMLPFLFMMKCTNVFVCVRQLHSLVAALGDSASCWPTLMLVYSLAFCISIQIQPTVLSLANFFTVRLFFLVKDRTLCSLHVRSDGASVLELLFLWSLISPRIMWAGSALASQPPIQANQCRLEC